MPSWALEVPDLGKISLSPKVASSLNDLIFSGLIVGLREIGNHDSGSRVFVGVLMLVTSLGFGVVAIADLLMLVRVSGGVVNL